MQQFYQQGLQQNFVPQMAFTIDQQVMEANLNVQLLIAGVDDSGAHLFQIENPGGTFRDFESIGFSAIGSGTLHALQSIIGFGHTPARGLYDTVFGVFVSKRRAQVAPGVGKDTDLYIVHDGGVTSLGQPEMDRLEALYQEYQQPVSEDLRTKIAALQLLNGKEAES